MRPFSILLRWFRRPSRSCWVWCPFCRHDLNGDEASFISETEEGVVLYRCAGCGRESRFDFNPPVPVLFPSARPSVP